MFLLEEAVLENSVGTDPLPEGEKKKKTNQEEFLFKDPEAYKKMTPEQKKAETDRLKGKLKETSFAGVK